MKTLFNPDHRADIVRRIESIGPTSERLWGSMTVPAMLCHCGDQLRLALGEIQIKPVKSFVGWKPVSWLLINVLPWPKGIKTVRELMTTKSEELEADRARLIELIERYAARGIDGDWATHPIFGKISNPSWGVLAWRHLDHHLRQFSA